MLCVGFIGWRGMVGSVLLQRMREESDLAGIEPVFFTTSNVGGPVPKNLRSAIPTLLDAKDLRELTTCPVLISCHGGDYTTEVYGALRQSGWRGYWIDAASTLAIADDAIIILDPVNDRIIREGLSRGIRTFVGGNCVSLMLMAVGARFQQGIVEWATTMTYQAASGAGAAKMLELVRQMKSLTEATAGGFNVSVSDNALEVDRAIAVAQRAESMPTGEFCAPLAGSLLPWIDREMPGGQTREEWKGMAETNKILGLNPEGPVDGICVRVGPCAAIARRSA